MTAKKHLPILDFLRCVASLSVCALHMEHYSGLHDDKYRFTDRILGYGQHGVAIFFVISGFVIPYSLWNVGYATKDFLRFLLRRIVRIDPSYFVAILWSITLLYQWSGIEWTQFALHFLYLIPLSKYNWYLGVFWTLGIEFQYYLIMGLLFVWLKKGNIYMICAALIAASCIGYFIPINKADAFILMYLHYFAIGILCFLYKIGRISLKTVHMLIVFVCLYVGIRISIASGLAGYIPCILILHANFKTRITNFLSKISYSLYLIHVLAAVFMLKIFNGFHGQNRYLVFVILVLGDILIAYLLYKAVEKPTLALSKKIKIKSSNTTVPYAAQASGN